MVADSILGNQAKGRVAEVLLQYVRRHFRGNLAEAAADLGYERQRLYSYTSQTSFPSAEVFDKVREKWNLDLLSLSPPEQLAESGVTIADQWSLFEHAVRLKNEGMEIVLERKGPGIAVQISVSPDVRIA
jgi:hypothetical protein